MTCAIIDDEPLAAELLASYAQKTTFLDLIGTYNSAIEAMRVLRTTPVDLIFLDIQMPELSGLEFATILSPRTMIIFTTAFDRYAVDSYKVNCVDYLLKPISYEAFLHSANKALTRLEESTGSQQQTGLTFKSATTSNFKSGASAVTSSLADRFFYVKSEYKIVRIFLDDLLYVEGLKDYVRFVLRPDSISASQSSKSIMCLMNMKTVEDALPQPEFMRIHRSYIVHIPLADAIDRTRIVFGETMLPISDSYKDTVLQYINAHTL